MKILIAHVRYRLRGGEDEVVDNEAALLASAGHDVRTLVVESAQLDSLGLGSRTSIVAEPAFHRYGQQLMRDALDFFDAEIVHFHNLFPLLGLGAATEARSQGVAVVRTLHNWRLSCLAGTHLLDGEECRLCRPGHYMPGVVRGCYRGSRLLSVEMARFCMADWAACRRGIFDRLLAVNEFIRQAYGDAGLTGEAISTKANSVDSIPLGDDGARDASALYVGRLSAEKGVQGLIGAWPAEACELVVVGDGPLAGSLRETASRNVRLVGAATEQEVDEWLRRKAVVVIPSLSEEGPPLVFLKALASGTPVAAFERGPIGELVSSIDPSAAVTPGDYDSLVEVACSLVPYRGELGSRARSLHAEMFSHAANVKALEDVYADAIGHRR